MDPDKTITFKNKILTMHSRIKDHYSKIVFQIFEDLTCDFPLIRKHHLEVSKYSKMLAENIKSKEKEISEIYNAALLHNIAILGIKEKDRLESPSLEKNKMQITQMSIELLNSFKILDNEIPIILHMNEHYNGSGKPYHLKGDLIPLGSRIISIVDTFQTLTAPPFPSMQPFSRQEGLNKIRELSGTQLDPDITEKFIALMVRKDEKKLA